MKKGVLLNFEKPKQRTGKEVRWWYCILGHHWEKWESDSIRSEDKLYSGQRRFCKVCGKGQRRFNLA